MFNDLTIYLGTFSCSLLNFRYINGCLFTPTIQEKLVCEGQEATQYWNINGICKTDVIRRVQKHQALHSTGELRPQLPFFS
ncbi:hypothetical protein HPP92_001107 [Vanilla planifolia]|uniref:Uncharacterized protein n=1 Tax=Vanilla planifolia TaxID=51239 RepID=A0A835RYP3_VANPL|nr:hypothetical protein HPP92_001107 [Vanilla planifolia]